jgi:hypothetical protein
LLPNLFFPRRTITELSSTVKIAGHPNRLGPTPQGEAPGLPKSRRSGSPTKSRESTMLKSFAAAAAALVLSAGAHASTVVFDASSFQSGDVDTHTSFNTSAFGSPAASGLLSFTLEGFDSLDGRNFYEDDFTLTVNNVAVLVGTFAFGGGGSTVVYSSPAGTTITPLALGSSAAANQSGALDFTVPVSLLSSGNVIRWTYVALSDSNHAGFQGIGDEGWGLADIKVTAVPEPGSLALMLAGLGIVGGLARRRGTRQA